MKEALDILSSIPRTFVNLVEPFNLGLVKQLNQGMVCDLIHAYECPHIAYHKANIREAEGESVYEGWGRET